MSWKILVTRPLAGLSGSLWLNGARPVSYRLDDREAALYELCADARRKEDIAAHFKGDDRWVDGALADLCAKDLMLALDGKYLALALPENRFL